MRTGKLQRTALEDQDLAGSKLGALGVGVEAILTGGFSHAGGLFGSEGFAVGEASAAAAGESGSDG